MINIIVFGTGSSAMQFLSAINNHKINIIAFSDNNRAKHYQLIKNYKIIPPMEIMQHEFDYVFVASQFSDEIVPQLIRLGIDYNKIIPTDSTRHNILMNARHEKANELVRGNLFSKKTKIKIALQNYNYSNYNGYALYKYMPDYIKEKYDVNLIEEKNLSNLVNYDVICSSLFEGIYKEGYTNLEFWHGFPLKRIGVMDSLNINKEFLHHIDRSTKNTDIVFSYSELYTTFFNSSFPTNISKYKITGMPRNDLLFEKNSLNKLETITEKNLSTYNIAFYLPTWRKGENIKRIDAARDWNLLFGFEDENESEIIKMINDNNLFLIVKLHPYEYDEFKDLNIFKHERVHLIKKNELEERKIHLYEILSAGSFIITDYSSIFFDLLLLDMPVIFTPTDLNEYRDRKGFLIEPYNYMTPGAEAYTLSDLNKEINNLLSGHDSYKEKRINLKNIIFKYFDNGSSARSWAIIDEYLEYKFKED